MKIVCEKFKSTNVLTRVCLALIAVMAVSGCATNGFLGFGDPLTTSSYVDGALAESAVRIDATEQETERIAREFAVIKTDIEALNTLKNEIENLVATMERNQKETVALQKLAARVGERLEEMPTEMLRQLVQALQTYLEMIESEGTSGS